MTTFIEPALGWRTIGKFGLKLEVSKSSVYARAFTLIPNYWTTIWVDFLLTFKSRIAYPICRCEEACNLGIVPTQAAADVTCPFRSVQVCRSAVAGHRSVVPLQVDRWLDHCPLKCLDVTGT